MLRLRLGGWGNVPSKSQRVIPTQRELAAHPPTARDDISIDRGTTQASILTGPVVVELLDLVGVANR